MKFRATSVAILAIASLTFACSDDSETNNGTPTPEPDMSAANDAGQDAADTDGAVNPQICDPIAQDCVVAGASKCEARYEEMSFSYTCGEDGSAGLLESCENPNGVPGEDTCAAGLWCSPFGLPISDPQQRQCLELCSADAPCDDEARTCFSLTAAEPYGTCVLDCDPLDDQCPDGTKCGSYFSSIQDETIWICDYDSGAEVGTPCGFSLDCGAGQSCSRLDNQTENVCNVVCEGDDDCADGEFCQISPASNGIGYCFTPEWSCVGSVTVPTPTVAEVDFPIFVRNDFLIGDGMPVEGASVSVCAADDIDCANPLDTQTTGADGIVGVTVPTGTDGFDGYFEISAEGRQTALAYYSLPIVEAPMLPATFELLLDDLSPYWDGVTIDETRGSIFANVWTCPSGEIPPLPGGDVSIASSNADGSTVDGYAPLTLEPSRFDQERSATTFLAIAAMVNHPVGNTDLTFTKFDGAEVASRSVIVRADAVTTVDAYPTP